MAHKTNNEGQSRTGWSALHGVAGGLIAGAVFALAEMVGASLLTEDGFFGPLRAIASVPLGDRPPTIDLVVAIPVGLVSHAVLSIAFGLVATVAVAYVPALRATRVVTVVAASAYGLALWLVNFYVIAPAINRPWFEEMSAAQQFVYHTFFFGTVLGLYLAWALSGAVIGTRRIGAPLGRRQPRPM